MASENFWRRDRHSQDRDRESQRWESQPARREENPGQDPDRGYGLGSQDDQGFQRRGWREGSDYYGNRDERFSGGGSQQRFSGQRGYGDQDYNQGGDDFGQSWRSDRAQGQDQGAGSRQGVHYGGRGFGRGEDESRGAFGSGGYGRDMEQGRRGALGYGGYGGMGGAETGSSAYGADEQFRGRGPRGYRRGDERIREDICETLTDDPYLDASNLEVTVKDCEVTLSGSVSTRDDKRRAEALAERISGVKDVHNTLRVVSSEASVADQRSSGGSEAQRGSSPEPRANPEPRH